MSSSTSDLVRQIEAHARRLAKTVAEGSGLYQYCLYQVDQEHDQRKTSATQTRDRLLVEAKSRFDQSMVPVKKRGDAALADVSLEFERSVSEAETANRQRIAAADAARRQALAAIQSRSSTAAADKEAEHSDRLQVVEDRYRLSIAEIEASYAKALTDWRERLLEGESTAGLGTAEFDSDVWSQVTLPDPLRGSVLPVRLGSLTTTLHDTTLELSACPPFLSGSSLLFKANPASKAAASEAIQAFLLRLLAVIPPGKLHLTFIDPIGLGQNVAGFMHLADYNSDLVTGKAWTQAQDIERRLADLTEHIEYVIQKYLRNQYVTIADYNLQAGEVAEAYRVLVILDFPASFTEAAIQRLVSITQNGPRCGVYTIIQDNIDKPLPRGFSLRDVEQGATIIAWDGTRFVWEDPDFKKCVLKLDSAPPPELVTPVLQAVGAEAIRAVKVEIPFDRIMPSPSRWWAADSAQGLSVPLGPSGARQLQHLELGSGTAQHVLIAGKTGSGKSNLLHVLITNSALLYSPDHLQLYLIDFKKGVEFKIYASYQLPHARVIAIESEREFGLSVLQGLDTELKARGDLFRSSGVDHIAEYRRQLNKPLPRILLLVDEFQEFFTEDDAVASQAAQILDRLVRQGRAFGIHVLLGSQTLAGAYSLARSTMDQMAVRIALECTEADSRLILADDNPGARLLRRPGEAIYNAANGLVEGNNRFQAAWLPDQEHQGALMHITEFARRQNYARRQPQIVFEGNAPADVANNRLLNELISGSSRPTPARAELAWLGEPVAIRDPLAAVFGRQSGSNLLLIRQNDETVLGPTTVALVSLIAQAQLRMDDGKQTTTFHVLDFSASDGPYADFFSKLPPPLSRVLKVGRRRHLAETLAVLTTELQRRTDADDSNAPPLYLFVHGLQRARDLHQRDGLGFSTFGTEEEAGPDLPGQFATIMRDGPELGIHTVVWCDSLTNLNRALDRRSIREFAMRVVFQMSAEDSANLIETPAASKLGPYQALFYHEDEGRLEKFRPYALPSEQWLLRVAEALQRNTVTQS